MFRNEYGEKISTLKLSSTQGFRWCQETLENDALLHKMLSFKIQQGYNVRYSGTKETVGSPLAKVSILDPQSTCYHTLNIPFHFPNSFLPDSSPVNASANGILLALGHHGPFNVQM